MFAASNERVLYNFNGTDGDGPNGLIFDAAGNLYGTTAAGGGSGCNGGCGTVFELTPGLNGQWAETVLYSFCAASNCTDGAVPLAGLIFDAAGNLYGTTEQGGSYSGCLGYSCGTAFQLSPGANGKWTEKVLHSFGKGQDGWWPDAGLILDAAGSLYGTTSRGGGVSSCNGNDCGTVFELTTGANGKWKEKVLHRFGKGMDGIDPEARLIFDAAGNLYGTTQYGGNSYCNVGCGTVFELTPGANGRWTERILHRFDQNLKPTNGLWPRADLIFDTAGNLYGTTTAGGSDTGYCFGGCGTVFQLAPGANGKWEEKVLHRFNDNGEDGYSPYAGLTFDAAGNLYGTTYFGGASGTSCENGCGTVFRLALGTNGKWKESVLHSFNSNGTDGVMPTADLILDAAGNLYGATGSGGAYGCNGSGCGIVFEITP